MKHPLIRKSTPEQLRLAESAADWLIDAVACATQDRTFLRGDEKCNKVVCDAIIANGIVACLRALHGVGQ